MKKRNNTITALILFLSIFSIEFTGYCFSGNSSQNSGIPETEKANVIKAVCDLLTAEYIRPDMAQALVDALTTKLERGDYAKAETRVEFADMIFRDLYTIADDKHFYFYYDPAEAELIRLDQSDDPADRAKAYEQLRERSRLQNFGFEKLERLKGNIGYLDLRFFHEPRFGGETAVAAMQFLSNCDAVIIDLRENHGGDSGMVRMLASYFLEEETLLRTMVYLSGEERQGWTLPYVPGRKIYDKDLYILVSSSTGSAAEAFSYFMKNHQRATLVGETTNGAAHNIREVVILDRYILNLPDKKPIDPMTRSNWEKTGVKPHIETEKRLAFEKAYQMAIEKMTAAGENSFETDWVYALLQAKTNPIVPDRSVLESFAGEYENKTVFLKGDKLFYQTNDEESLEMMPLSELLFQVDHEETFRVRFIKKNDSIAGIEVVYEDGFVLRKKRTG